MKTLVFILTILGSCIAQKVSAQKNVVQLSIGLGGSDGVDEQSIYEIGYKRKISKIVCITLQYATYSGDQRGLGSGDEIFVGTRYLGPKNESLDGFHNVGLYSSYYLGVELGIVRTTSTTLYLIGGTRFLSQSQSTVTGTGSRPDNLEVNFASQISFGPEIGIGYERRFTKNYSVGGKFIIGPNTSFFGALLTAGVYF